MWGGLLIEYHTTQQLRLANSWLEESKNTHSRRSTAVRTCMQVDQTSVRSRMRACLRSQACARLSEKCVITCNIFDYSLRILFSVILLIASYITLLGKILPDISSRCSSHPYRTIECICGSVLTSMVA